MPAALDALVIGLYVEIDDFLGPPPRAGPPAEAHRRRADHARGRAGLSRAAQRPPVPRARALAARAPVPGADRPVGLQPPAARALAPQIGRCINYLAFVSPSFCDSLRLLDSTPVPCGQSRETVKRSEFAGHAGYGYCRSHSQPLVLGLSALPALRRRRDADRLGARRRQHRRTRRRRRDARARPCRRPHGDRRQELLRRRVRGADGRPWGALSAPDRKDEPRRHGSLGRVRQWIESTFWTCKGQLGLERHGARTLPGLAPASGSDCSPSPPASGTTTSPATPPEPSPPTAANSHQPSRAER